MRNDHRESYRRLLANVRKMITRKKNETWERRCSRLNTYIGGTRSSESWKLLKTLRQNKKKKIISPISLTKWNTYFSSLLTVKETCKKLKNRKAPGPGNIPAELIKNGTPKLFEHITKLFQKKHKNWIKPYTRYQMSGNYPT